MRDQDRIAEIQNRTNAATAGPWRVEYDRDGSVAEVVPASGETVECNCAECSREKPGRQYSVILETDAHCYGPTAQDAEFLAHARDDVPYLLDKLAALRALVQQWRAQSASNEQGIGGGPWDAGQSAGLEQCADQLERLITGAE